jgi:nucleotide-binding universal stress UspA family protein
VDHLLLVHFGTSASSDLFTAALTMLDPQVVMTVVSIPGEEARESEIDWLQQDLARAKQLDRDLELAALPEGNPTEQLLNLTRELKCDLLLLGATIESLADNSAPLNFQAILRDAPCQVCLLVPPGIPQEVDQ